MLCILSAVNVDSNDDSILSVDSSFRGFAPSIMSSNKILQRVDWMKTVTKGNQVIRLSVATVTQCWIRPAVAVEANKDSFTNAVEIAKIHLPNGTAEVAMR